MALKPCRECGAQVSNTAATCPICGFKSPIKKPIGCTTTLLITVATLFIGMIVFDLNSSNAPSHVDSSRSPSSAGGGSANGWHEVTDSTTAFGRALEKTGNCYSTSDQRKFAVSLVRSFGYDCSILDAICPFAFSEGAYVHCNNGRYKFEIENHGGRWSAKAD